MDAVPPIVPPAETSVATRGNPPDPIATLEPTTDPIHHRALAVCAAVALAAIAWLALPVAVGLLLGTLLAFTLQPLHQTLRARMRRGRAAAALVCVLGTTVALVVALGSIGYLLVGRGVVMAQALIAALAPGAPARATLERFAVRVHLPVAELATRLRGVAVATAERAASVAATVAGATLSGLLVLFFVMLSMHFVLAHGPTVASHAERVLPLPRRHTRALIEEFRRVGRSVLLGTVLTGLAQGAAAGVGYAVCRVPEAAFFAAATAVASLIPAVGTLLVWVPVGVWLLATGHTSLGLLELTWGGLVVVGASDYVIRPWLVGSDHDTPLLVTLVALFGGVEVFGLIGLVLGPLIMSLALSLLRMFERESPRWRPGSTGP